MLNDLSALKHLFVVTKTPCRMKFYYWIIINAVLAVSARFTNIKHYYYYYYYFCFFVCFLLCPPAQSRGREN